jgi:hypothetical protein
MYFYLQFVTVVVRPTASGNFSNQDDQKTAEELKREYVQYC